MMFQLNDKVKVDKVTEIGTITGCCGNGNWIVSWDKPPFDERSGWTIWLSHVIWEGAITKYVDPHKFQIGDKVQYNVKCATGTGVVIEYVDGEWPYRLKYPAGSTGLFYEHELELI